MLIDSVLLHHFLEPGPSHIPASPIRICVPYSTSVCVSSHSVSHPCTPWAGARLCLRVHLRSDGDAYLAISAHKKHLGVSALFPNKADNYGKHRGRWEALLV